jgi:hypothetical protein
MADTLDSAEAINSLLLIKAVLAALAVLLFLYYRFHWERAKRHLQVHYFFAKWRTVRLAFALGIASVGFAAGFLLELFGASLGLSPNWSRAYSSAFEIGSLLCMLWVFFTLALEDVPHFQHIEESAGRLGRGQPKERREAASAQAQEGKARAAPRRTGEARRAGRQPGPHSSGKKGKRRKR